MKTFGVVLKYALFIFGFYLAFAFAILPLFLFKKSTQFFEYAMQIVHGRDTDG